MSTWNGPKIGKYGKKYLGFYDINLKKSLVPKEFDILHQKLRYNEFRKINEMADIVLYQFIYPISTEQYNSYQKGHDDLVMTTSKIVEYANQRDSLNSSMQTHTRLRRYKENKWKQWYSDHQQSTKNALKKHNEFKTQIDNVKLKYDNKLLRFQIDHVKKLLASFHDNLAVLDASDTGTGKTYSALCVAKELNLIPIVVCPKSVIPHWYRASKYFEVDNIYVSNYEQYRIGSTPYLIKKNEDNPFFIDNISDNDMPEKIKQNHIPRAVYEWQLDANKHLLIFDECHKTKNTQTYNYAIFWWARQQNLRVLSLSATVADKIEVAYGITYMLRIVDNLKQFNQKYQTDLENGILKDFGYEVNNDGNYRFNDKYRLTLEELKRNNENLHLLHEDMFPLHGSRMVIAEIGADFPDNFVDAQTFEMGQKANQIQDIYNDMEYKIYSYKLKQLEARITEREMLETMSTRCELDPKYELRLNQLRKESVSDREKIIKLKQKIDELGGKIKDIVKDLSGEKMDDTNEIIFTALLRARQRVELLKVETIFDLTLNFLEEGKSIVIFVNFNETIDYLKNLFDNKKIPLSQIRGNQIRAGQRDEQIQLFQNNINRVMLANIQSGGVGVSLHDLHGGHPRVSLISPSWSAQDLIQALGRIHRAEGKSKCLQYLIFCARTIEDRICLTIKQKLQTIKTLNDGDLDGLLTF